jgi:uncharacterized protein involved in cysteine biosynthesis
MNFFNNCQRTMIGMTLLLDCLLIFLIRKVRISQFHSALNISHRPSTYQWILYSHLSGMIIYSMVLHQDLKNHCIFGRIL